MGLSTLDQSCFRNREMCFEFADQCKLISLFQVRKMVYIQGNSVPHANHGVLEKLIASRHELAQVSTYSFMILCSIFSVLNDCSYVL